MASGALWAGLVHLSQKGRFPVLRESTGQFGGNGKEPNGLESLIWTVIVFGPLTLAAFYLTSHHRADNPSTAYVGYLVGTALGAFTFYGCRVRERVLKRGYSYFKRETWLVFYWAVLLAIPGFVGQQTGLLVHGGPETISVQRMLTQSLFVIAVLWTTVTGFVALVPGDEHQNVRGMWAGGFLVFASLAALLIMEPADLFSLVSDIVSPL